MAAVVVAVIVGVALMAVAFTFGRCDAFGGRCPADSPPILDDDTFGIAATGAAMAVGVPMLLYGADDGPRWRRALAAAAVAGLLVGLAARGAATG